MWKSKFGSNSQKKHEWIEANNIKIITDITAAIFSVIQEVISGYNGW